MNGRFLRFEGATRRRFLHPLLVDAASITDADLSLLLSDGRRPRLTAAWLIGISRRTSCRARIGELLLESAMAYAGRGHCFALARLGAPEDAEILVAYLDRYLPAPTSTTTSPSPSAPSCTSTAASARPTPCPSPHPTALTSAG